MRGWNVRALPAADDDIAFNAELRRSDETVRRKLRFTPPERWSFAI